MIAEEVKSREGAIGFDANTGEFVDMFKAGIVDPTKVTRSALQNAASIAALMLTTEAMITNIKDDEKENAARVSKGPSAEFGSALSMACVASSPIRQRAGRAVSWPALATVRTALVVRLDAARLWHVVTIDQLPAVSRSLRRASGFDVTNWRRMIF